MLGIPQALNILDAVSETPFAPLPAFLRHLGGMLAPLQPPIRTLPFGQVVRDRPVEAEKIIVSTRIGLLERLAGNQSHARRVEPPPLHSIANIRRNHQPLLFKQAEKISKEFEIVVPSELSANHVTPVDLLRNVRIMSGAQDRAFLIQLDHPVARSAHDQRCPSLRLFLCVE